MKQEFTDTLRTALDADLPGYEAQSAMEPQYRGVRKEVDSKKAAVFIGLYDGSGCVSFPLIRRAEDGYAHSGQIALPGGSSENGESPAETALREAWEETGIDPEGVEVLGQLTSLYIPVSNFSVTPVLGLMKQEPVFKRCEVEVVEIFSINLGELVDPRNVSSEIRTFRDIAYRIPCFEFNNHVVWGATAMILCELKSIVMNANLAELC